MPKEFVPQYSRREEWANMLTHASGVAFSVAALVILIRYALSNGDGFHVVGVSIFGACLILSYLSSTVYHTLREAKIKHAFRVVDHACIFLLIAGSYTPFLLVNLRGGWGWSLFGVTWGLALAGILFKVLFVKRFRIVSVLIYIGMGWLIVIAIKPTIASIQTGGLIWLLIGGLMYTGGTTFYLWRKLPYNHAIWHLFVMAGSFCHFLAILWYVAPAKTVS